MLWLIALGVVFVVLSFLYTVKMRQLTRRERPPDDGPDGSGDGG